MAVKITPGNTADSTVLDEMTRHLAGKLYADKGYIGQDLFKTLWQRGLHLITGIRRNYRYPPEHAELSDASGRQGYAAQTLRHRDRARYPEIRNGARAFTP